MDNAISNKIFGTPAEHPAMVLIRRNRRIRMARKANRNAAIAAAYAARKEVK